MEYYDWKPRKHKKRKREKERIQKGAGPAERLGYLVGKMTDDQIDDDEEQEVELELFLSGFIMNHK